MSEPENAVTPQSFFKYDAALIIIRTLRQKGYKALLAGGCVRDVLLRLRPQDYDIVTNARPEVVKQLFERTIAVGEKFGVVKVVMSGLEFEVATFRVDESYKDGRRPQSVRYADERDDALRRDFTINGMFYDPVEGTVFDYVEGQEDLKRRIVRAIGDPEERFNEDYLRMLRGVRFSTTLGFQIEPRTLKAIEANAPKIAGISGERIRAELEQILVHANRKAGLDELYDTGLLQQILPEVAAFKGVKQGKTLHPEGDVWQHTVLAMSLLENPSFELAMAVLFHDVGKPETAEPAGERLFVNHERVGEQIFRQVASRLALSKRETETIAFLVHYHMTLKDVTNMRKSTLKRTLGHELFPLLAEVHRVDALASNGDLTNYEYAMRAKFDISAEALKPKPLVDGEALAAIGIPRDAKMGKILKAIYTAQLDEEITTRDEALEMAAKLAAEPPPE